MVEKLRITSSVAEVLGCFLSDPEADRYGLDLMGDTGLASGTLYPILIRLQRAGWVETAWEDIDPHAAGRPARRYYRLTPEGVTAARAELAALYQRLSKVPGITGKPRTV